MILIGTPIPFGYQMNAKTAGFCSQMIKQGHQWMVCPAIACYSARNQIAAQVLRHKEISHLLLMDADTVAPLNTIDRLFSLNKDIVSAVVPVWQWKRKWNAQLEPSGLIDYDKLPAEPFKALGASQACALISRRVLETMSRPWWVTTYDKDGNLIETSSFYFTNKAKKLGYEIWVDPTLKCGHYHTIDLKEIFDDPRI